MGGKLISGAKLKQLDSAAEQMLMRSAPAILKDVLYESKVAAATLRKANGGLTPNQEDDFRRVFSNCTTHQKSKIVLDTLASVIMQPEVLGKIIEDALEDSKDGKTSRLGLLRGLLGASPKELTVDVVTKHGVMLVPTKADSLTDWMREQGIGQPVVDGTVNDPNAGRE